MSASGRWWRLAAVAVVAVLVAALVGVVVAFPSVAAITCPGCYGLEQERPGLYVEPGLTAVQHREVIHAVDEGTQRVKEYFGDLRSEPDVLVCLTEECYTRIGGGRERGIAVLYRAVMLSPRGIDPVIAAHELTHVELRARLGRASVPQWFDEGLAVLVSDDPRYLLPEGAPDRCRVEPTGPLPETLDAWLRDAGEDAQVYAQAACVVSRWTAWNDLHGLIAHLAAGGAFPQS
ncbi:hypothetical protein FHX44_114762 [Pseudonocardia hierapolitana]|uniref:Peptidase MA superfamily protein n=1 Tax=Pseudonocardia hierapolitana TaxID=1128676 RepID=A0A561SVE7_9PSEU|nr:hypothetical protein [Pseudonocardia hierapolitana]TWF78838.1 hypothetical protein FHX44_114762 [Pseudonocardia hierapolitana]